MSLSPLATGFVFEQGIQLPSPLQWSYLGALNVNLWLSWLQVWS